MTSAHRYPQHPQNPPKLPSLRDLNFYRPSGPGAPLPSSQQPEQPGLQPEQPPQPPRHQAVWGRSPANTYLPPSSAAGAAHQQQYASGHEVTPKVEYPQKHEHMVYAHPGIPLSAQSNPVPGSINSRIDDASHSPNHPKKQRTGPTTASRDVRGSQPNGYPQPQYATYGPASQYHSAQQGLPSAPPSHTAQPAPPPHEQISHHPHPIPVTAHPGYPSYHSAYVHPRQTLLHPQHPSQPDHPNSYPSSGPPPPPPSLLPQQAPWTHQQQPPAAAQPQFHQQQQTPVPQPSQQNPPPHIPSQHHPHHHQQQRQHQQPPVPPPPAQQPQQQQQQQQHHQHPPPPAPASAPPASHPQLHQIQPPVQYPHQQQQQQYQPQYQHPPPPQQQQQQQHAFVRQTGINPSSLENRPTYNAAEPPRIVLPVQNDSMSEMTDHCKILYNFANRYAALYQSHVQPSNEELEEMSHRAMAVVRLLTEIRRINIPEGAQLPIAATNPSPASVPLPQEPSSTGESSRPPKRPWEDTAQEEGASAEADVFQDQFPANPPTDPKSPTTAEQDMEIIRTKRATSTAVTNGTGGQPKSKYRKRSRASPPGKCHSCNIRETPEWRRGPDGARTLCNACGLHYAKLMRKQNKAAVNGEVPHIDLETLRASTRAADLSEKGRSGSSKQSESSKAANRKSSDPSSPVEGSSSSSAGTRSVPPPQPQTTHHQGSFQLVSLVAAPQDHNMGQDHGHMHGPNSSSATGATAVPVDSRPASQHASSSTAHMQPAPAPAPPTGPSHHPGPHQQQHPPQPPPPPPQSQHQPSSGPGGSSLPPPPPWPTTAATTGPAANAGTSTISLRAASNSSNAGGGGGGGSSGGHMQYNGPPPPAAIELARRQYSMGRLGGQQPSR